jgi:hypothetical protein
MLRAARRMSEEIMEKTVFSGESDELRRLRCDPFVFAIKETFQAESSRVHSHRASFAIRRESPKPEAS